MYRLKEDPKIVVEKLGEGYQRLGATVKFPAVTYRDKEGNVDSRHTAEFERIFERVSDPVPPPIQKLVNEHFWELT